MAADTVLLQDWSHIKFKIDGFGGIRSDRTHTGTEERADNQGNQTKPAAVSSKDLHRSNMARLKHGNKSEVCVFTPIRAAGRRAHPASDVRRPAQDPC